MRRSMISSFITCPSQMSGEHTIIGSTAGCSIELAPTDHVGVDPLLDPLGDHAKAFSSLYAFRAMRPKRENTTLASAQHTSNGRRTAMRGTRIVAIAVTGGDPTPLIAGPRVEFAPTFSPNGRRIAFNRQGNDDRFGVWIMRADGSHRVQKTFGKFDFFPDWQPI